MRIENPRIKESLQFIGKVEIYSVPWSEESERNTQLTVYFSMSISDFVVIRFVHQLSCHHGSPSSVLISQMGKPTAQRREGSTASCGESTWKRLSPPCQGDDGLSLRVLPHVPLRPCHLTNQALRAHGTVASTLRKGPRAAHPGDMFFSGVHLGKNLKKKKKKIQGDCLWIFSSNLVHFPFCTASW